MKKSKNALRTFLLLGSLLLLNSFIFGQENISKNAQLELMKRELNLTNEQVKQVRAVEEKYTQQGAFSGADQKSPHTDYVKKNEEISNILTTEQRTIFQSSSMPEIRSSKPIPLPSSPARDTKEKGSAKPGKSAPAVQQQNHHTQQKNANTIIPHTKK